MTRANLLYRNLSLMRQILVKVDCKSCENIETKLKPIFDTCTITALWSEGLRVTQSKFVNIGA